MEERLLKLHAAVGGKSFVGIKFLENNIDFYYPETFDWKEDVSFVDINSISDNISNGIRNILSSIELAKTRSIDKSKLNDFSDADELFAMKAYIWIIQDYMCNGYYKNRETIYRKNQNGRINWKHTLRNQPIYSNGSFIFNDFISSTKSSVDNLLVEIHRFCVRKSIFLIGWLFNIPSASMEIKNLTDIVLSDTIKKQYVYALKYELDRTFDDEKKMRLSNMLDVVEGLNKSQNGCLSYGVDSYHYVFEQMIDNIYGTLKGKEKEQYFPCGKWSNGMDASPLIPDTIHHIPESNTYIIIDAKYYRYSFEGYIEENTNGLPGTDSIQKQLTYGDKLLEVLSNQGLSPNIYNCFLLPFNMNIKYSNIKPDNYILYSGVYGWGSWRQKKETYDRIYIFLIDMRTIIEIWNNRNHDCEQKYLSDLLNKTKESPSGK